MSVRRFSLRQFPGSGLVPDLCISGSIGRTPKMLSVECAFQGCCGDLEIPAPAAPMRKHGLWNETCFELFIAEQGSRSYREFNLSPAGHWNVYRFASYRRDMVEEAMVRRLPFTVHRGTDELRFELELGLEKIVPAGRAVRVGISAVVRHKAAGPSYWALTHRGPEPDFHRRDGFTLLLR